MKNVFIAEDVSLKSIVDNETENTEHPIVLNKTALSTLYYRKDNTFEVPKSVIYVKVFTNDNNLGLDSKSQLFMSLWQKVINKKMNETVYLAEMANVHARCSSSANGMAFVFSGLNDNLDKLAEEYLKEILDINVDEFDQEIALNLEK